MKANRLDKRRAADPPRRAAGAVGLSVLLVALVLAVTVVLFALWWFGLGLDNGKALAASAMTLFVCGLLGELVRRRFRIRLHVVFAAMTVVAVLLGISTQPLMEARRQQHVVSRILRHGGDVRYDYRNESLGWFKTRNGWLYPSWLRGLLGDGLFATVRTASLRGQFQDAFMGAVYRDLPNLEGLAINGSQVSDEGLRGIEALHRLQRVFLDGHQVTATSVGHLRRVPELDVLWLYGKSVTNSTLEQVRALTNIREVVVWDASVDDLGLEHLAHMPHLKALTLTGIPISDAGIVHLTSMQDLRSLSLQGVPVSDNSVSQLAELQGLERIDFRRTQITSDGVRKLQEALPNSVIRHW